MIKSGGKRKEKQMRHGDWKWIGWKRIRKRGQRKDETRERREKRDDVGNDPRK